VSSRPRPAVVRALSSLPALVDCDEAALVPRLQRRDPEAAEVAWRRFSPMVRAAMRRMLGPSGEEEDAVQEVFLRFFVAVARLREPTLVRSFLFGICVRVARKEVRRKSLRSWLRLAPPEKLVDWPAVATDLDAREALRRFYAVLDGLGGVSRSLFVVRYLEGRELAEVARLHHVSVSTAQRKLARALERVTAAIDRDPLLARYISREERGGP
jgi:RNA polymerase sigma-70 factor, ECF subfamily